MKNLLKLFALVLILFVSCDTGLNNKKEEPQEPKLLSFKVKGFVDYDNNFQTETYTEAAEKLGTQDFVIKLGDFETLKRRDSLYITDYLALNGKEVEYVWDYEAEGDFEFDSSKIRIVTIENVTKDLYSYLGDEEDIIDYFVSFFEEKKYDMCLEESDMVGWGDFSESSIREKVTEYRSYPEMWLDTNLKLVLYEPIDEDSPYIHAWVSQRGAELTKSEFEKIKEEQNSSITLDDCIPFYTQYVMDEETGLIKVDENGNYIVDTSEDSIRYMTGIWYMVRCTKIKFAYDYKSCYSYCYVVY